MSEGTPQFSIVVPTHARPEQLTRCLEHLALVDYPRDRFEVIVVDDGSPEPKERIVAAVRDRLPIRVIRQQKAGPATARNCGAEHAVGEYIVFTDDDCWLAPDYLEKLEPRIRDHPEAMIAGRTENALSDNIFSAASQLLIDYLYGYFNANPVKSTLFTANNLVVPRAEFAAIGGFDTSFPFAAGEDRELCDRWQQSGRPMCYAPELVVHHAHEMNLRSFWRQHFNYGRGAFHFHQLRKRRGIDHVTPEPLSFYVGLLLYPLRRVRQWRSALYMGLLFVSQLANAVGFFSMQKRHDEQA